MKIIVELIAPPIPIRKFDYIAYLECDAGEEDAACGYGATVSDAVTELVESIDGCWPELERAAAK